MQVLSVPLIGLRHKTQWWEANLRVKRFWVPNTFPRPYLNSKPISLVVTSKCPSSKERYIYMIFRPLQKLGGNSFVVSIVVIGVGKLLALCLSLYQLLTRLHICRPRHVELLSSLLLKLGFAELFLKGIQLWWSMLSLKKVLNFLPMETFWWNSLHCDKFPVCQVQSC